MSTKDNTLQRVSDSIDQSEIETTEKPVSGKPAGSNKSAASKTSSTAPRSKAKDKPETGKDKSTSTDPFQSGRRRVWPD